MKNTKLIFLKARPVPYALKDKVEQEYDRLESEGIMEKVKHSEWGSPAVVIQKPDGGVRICVDYKATVNFQIAESRYPIPTVENVFHEL